MHSAEQNYIHYKGKQLQSGNKYYWKVKIWDNFEKESFWSENTFWTMGLLEPVDWKAEWISFDSTFIKTQPLFRKTFEADKQIKRATAYISGLGYNGSLQL